MPNFSELPQNIKEHLVSPRTASLFDSITHKAEIYEIGILPDLVSQLVTRNVFPQDFTSKLKEEVGTSDKKTKAIARELKEKVLEPIRYALVNWGVDINQIDVSGAPTLDEFIKEREEAERKQTERLASLGIENDEDDDNEKPAPRREEAITFDTLAAPAGEAVTIRPSEPAEDKQRSDEMQPLIIHRENPVPAAREAAGSKSFSLPFGFFRNVERTVSESMEPIKARVESPKEEKRVVHYSELRTPLTPFNKNDEFIHTAPFGAPTSAAASSAGFPSGGQTPSRSVPDGAKRVPIEGAILGTPPAGPDKSPVEPIPSRPSPAAFSLTTPTASPLQKTGGEAPAPFTKFDGTPKKNDPAPDLRTGKASWGFVAAQRNGGGASSEPMKTPVIPRPEAKTPVVQRPAESAPVLPKSLRDVMRGGGGMFKLPEKRKPAAEPQKNSGEAQRSSDDLAVFFSDIKKDIDREKKDVPPAAPREDTAKKEPGPHVEGNMVDLR